MVSRKHVGPLSNEIGYHGRLGAFSKLKIRGDLSPKTRSINSIYGVVTTIMVFVKGAWVFAVSFVSIQR